jgi:hypothetical protein
MASSDRRTNLRPFALGSWLPVSGDPGEPLYSAIVLARNERAAMMLQCLIGYAEGISAKLVLVDRCAHHSGPDLSHLSAAELIDYHRVATTKRREARRVSLLARWPDGRTATLTERDAGVELVGGRAASNGSITTAWLWIAPRVDPGGLELSAAWPGGAIDATSIRL